MNNKCYAKFMADMVPLIEALLKCEEDAEAPHTPSGQLIQPPLIDRRLPPPMMWQVGRKAVRSGVRVLEDIGDYGDSIAWYAVIYNPETIDGKYTYAGPAATEQDVVKLANDKREHLGRRFNIWTVRALNGQEALGKFKDVWEKYKK